MASLELLRSIKPFDVIRANGHIRVVRSVTWKNSYRDHPPVGSFQFIKLRCSWTRRPYTTYNTQDMKSWDIEVIGRNWKGKNSWLEKKLDAEDEVICPHEIEDCDVVGVLY